MAPEATCLKTITPVHSLRRYLLALSSSLTLILPACSGDDDGADLSTGRFSVELTGAETGTWSGEATFRERQRYVNNTARWTIDLETGDIGDEALLINLLNDADGAGDLPLVGSYDLGQFGPNSSGEDILFGEFYAVDAPDYRWVDNPGTVTIARAEDGVIAGTIEASIQNNSTGGFTTFSGSFTAVAD